MNEAETPKSLAMACEVSTFNPWNPWDNGFYPEWYQHSSKKGMKSGEKHGTWDAENTRFRFEKVELNRKMLCTANVWT